MHQCDERSLRFDGLMTLRSALSQFGDNAAGGPAKPASESGCGTAKFGDRMTAMTRVWAIARAERPGRRTYRLAAWIAGLVSCAPGFAQPNPPAAAPESAAIAAGAEPTAVATPPANRAGAGAEFEQLVTDERLADALPVGVRLVELTVQEFGKNSRQAAEAYADLADAQRRAGEYDAAEKSFLQAVEIYRVIDGPLTPLAIAPLTGLGDNYREDSEYLNAVTAYGEARTLSRRAFGLLNEAQIPLLDRLSETLLDLNKPAEADQQQIEARRLVQRSYPPESPESLAATYKYAQWLRSNSRFQEERDQYKYARRIIQEHFGKEDPRQVRCLLGIGNSYRSQRIPDGEGATALGDALDLLLAQSEHDDAGIAEALRDTGDWQVAFAKLDYDGAEYRRAWQLLGNVANGEQLRAEWFRGPSYVLREPVSLRGLAQDPGAPSGHVLVRFDLDANGRSANAVVVESDPPGFKDEAVLRHIRRSRFRPQMVDGEIVPAQSLALQFKFQYMPDAVEQGDN